jgi:hypothetical protein
VPSPDDLEAEFLAGDAGRRDGMGRVAEDEDALAGQIGSSRPSASTRAGARLGPRARARVDAGEFRHLADEVAGRADADRHGLGARLPKVRSSQRAAVSAISG